MLSAVPVLAGIEVSWSFPTTNPQAVAFVKLLRGTSTNIESAVEIAQVAGNSYFDRQNNNNTWYYWIRVLSSNGTEADPIGPASAAAVPTAGQLVELVQGAITSSALHQSLGEKIQLIDAVEVRLNQAIANREEAEGLISEAIQQATDAIDYVTNTLVVENAERVAAIGAAVDAIDQEVLDRINSDDAVKTVLRSEFTSGDAGALAAANSWTQTYTYNKATIDGAITFAGQQLKADYEAKDGLTLSQANAHTNSYTYAKAAIDGSIATAVSNLTAAFTGADATGYTNATAYTRDYTYNKATVDSALSSQASTLRAEFQGADATGYANAQAFVQSYAYGKATVDSAIAANGSTLEAKLRPRQNLLKNGGFEANMDYWSSATPGWGLVDGVWGRQIQNTSINTTAIGVLESSFQIPVHPGGTYTISADTALFAATGYCYVDLLFFNAAHAVVGDGGEKHRNAPHDFSETNAGRIATEVSAVAPATAIYARPRLVWGNITGLQVLALRQVKVERGGLPSTPFTSEATLIHSNARIDSVSIALATTTASVASTATTLRTEFANADTAVSGAINANLALNYYTRSAADSAMATKIAELNARFYTRANVLKNGSFERGLAGWTRYGDGNLTLTAQRNDVWGPIVAGGGGGFSGSNWWESEPLSSGPGYTYTIAGSMEWGATSGTGFFEVVAWTTAWVPLLVVRTPALSGHPFGTPREEQSATFSTPANTSHLTVRFVFEGIVGGAYAGVRQIKLEFGAGPCTPYSADGVLAEFNTSIKAVETAVADAKSSIAATANTLRTEFANADATTYSNAQSYVQGYAYSKTTVDSAIATKGDQLTTAFQTADQAINTNLANNYYTKSSADSAMASAVTTLQASIGAAFTPLKTWEFGTGGHDGWAGYGVTFADYAGTSVVTLTGPDPQLSVAVTPFSGYTYNKVRMRLRKTTPAPANWEGTLYYGNGVHSYSNSFLKVIPRPALLDANVWCIVEWDMGALNVGGDDWLLTSIDSIRIDLEHTGGSSYEIDWVAIGRHGTPVSETAITAIKDSIVTGDAATAAAIDVLQSKVVVRPNLLPNGGFELGLGEWTQWRSAGSTTPLFSVADSAYWGRLASIGPATNTINGTGVLQSRVSLGAYQGFVITGDSELICDSGQVYIDLLFMNAADVHIGGITGTKLNAHGFSTTNSNREAHAIHGVIPGGTAYCLVRCVYENVVNGLYVAFRQLKIENGSLPPTPYTSEATMVVMDAAIKTEAKTRSDQNSAQASLTTTIQAVIGKNRANLLKNSSWEAGDLRNWTPNGSTATGVFAPMISSAWGPIVGKSGTNQGTHWLASERIVAGPGWVFTLSGETEVDSAGGYTFMRVVAMNSAQQIIQWGEGTPARIGYHAFGSRSRAENSVAFTCPAGTAFVSVEVVFADMVNAIWMAARQIKLEAGAMPATPYSMETSVAGAYSAIQIEANTRADQTGSLFAKYTVKIDQNGYVTGYGLASETNNGATVSSFQVRADRFSIASPSGPGITPIVPFSVLTTPTVENGVTLAPGVYMDGLFIKNIRADRIDTRGLTVKDAAGNVILGSGNIAEWNNSYAASGKNMLPNSDQTSAMTWVLGYNGNGAVIDTPPQWTDTFGGWTVNDYALSGGLTRSVMLHQSGILPGGDAVQAVDIYPLTNFARQAAVPGQRYCWSVYCGVHRCSLEVWLGFFNAAGSPIAWVQDLRSYPSNGGLMNSLSAMTRKFVFGTAPAGTATVVAMVRKYNSAVGGFDSYVWLAAPMLEAAGASQTTPSPYQPGPISSAAQLGYTGALNATYGAVWNSGQIAGQPADSSITNTNISVSGGKLSGIGAGNGTLVDNTKMGDNLMLDPFYLNPLWWGISNFESANIYPRTGPAAGSQPANHLLVYPSAVDFTGQYFPVEQGATYRMKIRIYASPAAAGIFWWGLHCPNLQWFTPVPLNGGAFSDPLYGYNLDAVGTNGLSMRGNWTEFVATLAMVNGVNQIQSRMRNVLTAGYIEVHMELTRVFSFDNKGEVVGKIRNGTASTFIDNAALNYAQIGELRAQNISVGEISRAVNGGATGARVDIDGNRIRVFDGVKGFARVTLGYIG